MGSVPYCSAVIPHRCIVLTHGGDSAKLVSHQGDHKYDDNGISVNVEALEAYLFEQEVQQHCE